MSEWTDVMLGEVLTLQRGFDLPQRKRRTGPYPVVSSAGFTGLHDEFKVEPPGVVIGRYGSLGSVHWVGEPFWPLNTALWVKDFKGNDPRFISYLLETVTVDGSGAAAVPGVNRNHLHKQRARVPQVRLQRRISALLSTLDEMIEINERRIELLENLARSLYREWFVHFRFPGHVTSRFVDSELGRIPDGWTPTVASRIFDFNPHVDGRAGSYPKVTMGDVSTRFSHALPSASASRPSGARYRRGDVLLARITPSLENGKTALALFLGPDEVGIGSTELIVLRGTDVGSAFTYCAARSQPFRDHAIKSMSGASGRQRVASDCFDSLPMVRPTEEVASLFESVAMPMLEEVFQLRRQSDQLAETRDLLLPRLVTGRLDISDVDLGVLTPADPE